MQMILPSYTNEEMTYDSTLKVKHSLEVAQQVMFVLLNYIKTILYNILVILVLCNILVTLVLYTILVILVLYNILVILVLIIY